MLHFLSITSCLQSSFPILFYFMLLKLKLFLLLVSFQIWSNWLQKHLYLYLMSFELQYMEKYNWEFDLSHMVFLKLHFPSTTYSYHFSIFQALLRNWFHSLNWCSYYLNLPKFQFSIFPDFDIFQCAQNWFISVELYFPHKRIPANWALFSNFWAFWPRNSAFSA